MAQSVRKLDSKRVEVLFDKPLDPEAGAGKALTDFAAQQEDMELLTDADGRIEGVHADSKTYIAFLQTMNVSRENIALFRRSLDDSRKAVRERQREPRRPR